MGGLCSSIAKGTICTKNVNGDKEDAYVIEKTVTISPRTETTFTEIENATPLLNSNRLPTIPSTIDINIASEEDLMTLPTIGRALAHEIVEYRQKVRKFQTVNELVHVKGIGNARLEKIRKEIHVTSTNHVKPTNDKESTKKLVNINTAASEQLVKVNGISSELAKKIIEYRTNNGRFFHINDLVEPAALLDTPALLKLKAYITVDKNDTKRSRKASLASLIRNGSTDRFFHTGPESLENVRPSVDEFTGTTDDRPIVRIATWNLQQCSIDKVNNPGVREVICATIFESGIKILAVQELADKDVLAKIVEELNDPTLPNVQRAKAGTSTWDCAVSSTAAGRMYQGMEYTGFIFDTSSKIVLYSHALLEKPAQSREFARLPLLGYFKVNNMDIVLVSVHLKAIGPSSSAASDLARLNEEIENLPTLVEAIMERVQNENDVIIVGDFNLEPDQKEFDVLRNAGFSHVVPETVPTNISTKNMKGSRSCDNIWLNESASSLYSNQFKVVRNGMTNPWIPDGWSWGGVASDHCPVWAEFFTDQDYDVDPANKSLEMLRLSD